jgi:hypothetical protein
VFTFTRDASIRDVYLQLFRVSIFDAEISVIIPYTLPARIRVQLAHHPIAQRSS